MLTEEMTMTYEESVKYLYKIAGFATKSSLEDIKYFLERLGNPQKELHMIHEAGTNGKGSVCAFLEALLTQHGKKTASFTFTAADANRSSLISFAHSLIRSLIFTTCGEVKEAVFFPCWVRSASKNAQTDPFPFVPATWIICSSF